jgi:pimeloyl-ACP methyl ester carboxylesterase
MSAVTINNEIVHFEVLGRGPALILIHSWVGSWRYWVPTMQQLASRYRAYALDLWGFGDTSKVRERYAFENQVDLIRDFLEEMGIVRAGMVGHALGAAVALRFAEKHPDRVPRLMAIGLPMVGDASLSQRITSAKPADWLERLLSKDRPDFKANEAEAAKCDPEAVRQTAEALALRDWRSTLSAIEPPSVLVHGENDPLVHVPEEIWFDGLMHNKKVHRVLLNDSRHFPMLDETARFNRLLLDFLTTSDVSTLKLKEHWHRRTR